MHSQQHARRGVWVQQQEAGQDVQIPTGEITCFCLQHQHRHLSLIAKSSRNLSCFQFDTFVRVFYVKGTVFSPWDICIFCVRCVLEMSLTRPLTRCEFSRHFPSHMGSLGDSPDILLQGCQDKHQEMCVATDSDIWECPELSYILYYIILNSYPWAIWPVVFPGTGLVCIERMGSSVGWMDLHWPKSEAFTITLSISAWCQMLVTIDYVIVKSVYTVFDELFS